MNVKEKFDCIESVCHEGGSEVTHVFTKSGRYFRIFMFPADKVAVTVCDKLSATDKVWASVDLKHGGFWKPFHLIKEEDTLETIVDRVYSRIQIFEGSQGSSSAAPVSIATENDEIKENIISIIKKLAATDEIKEKVKSIREKNVGGAHAECKKNVGGAHVECKPAYSKKVKSESDIKAAMDDCAIVLSWDGLNYDNREEHERYLKILEGVLEGGINVDGMEKRYELAFIQEKAGMRDYAWSVNMFGWILGYYANPIGWNINLDEDEVASES